VGVSAITETSLLERREILHSHPRFLHDLNQGYVWADLSSVDQLTSEEKAASMSSKSSLDTGVRL